MNRIAFLLLALLLGAAAPTATAAYTCDEEKRYLVTPTNQTLDARSGQCMQDTKGGVFIARHAFLDANENNTGARVRVLVWAGEGGHETPAGEASRGIGSGHDVRVTMANASMPPRAITAGHVVVHRTASGCYVDEHHFVASHVPAYHVVAHWYRGPCPALP